MTDRDRPALMFYDGTCRFCSASAAYAERTGGGRIKCVPIQDETMRALVERHGIDASDPSTMLTIDGDATLKRSDAALAVAAKLGFPWSLLARVARKLPVRWRDDVYDLVARNRYRIAGRRTLEEKPR
jgi:predicted DCC family thiol-disulfide oxidoreductase YuxK